MFPFYKYDIQQKLFNRVLRFSFSQRSSSFMADRIHWNLINGTGKEILFYKSTLSGDSLEKNDGFKICLENPKDIQI
jgi:hypothetical protein